MAHFSDMIAPFKRVPALQHNTSTTYNQMLRI